MKPPALVYIPSFTKRERRLALRNKPVTIDEIVRDIHELEADLENYERKYGIISETFHEAYGRRLGFGLE
jgi:hypothetical protein